MVVCTQVRIGHLMHATQFFCHGASAPPHWLMLCLRNNVLFGTTNGLRYKYSTMKINTTCAYMYSLAPEMSKRVVRPDPTRIRWSKARLGSNSYPCQVGLPNRLNFVNEPDTWWAQPCWADLVSRPENVHCVGLSPIAHKPSLKLGHHKKLNTFINHNWRI